MILPLIIRKNQLIGILVNWSVTVMVTVLVPVRCWSSGFPSRETSQGGIACIGIARSWNLFMFFFKCCFKTPYEVIILVKFLRHEHAVFSSWGMRKLNLPRGKMVSELREFRQGHFGNLIPGLKTVTGSTGGIVGEVDFTYQRVWFWRNLMSKIRLD